MRRAVLFTGLTLGTCLTVLAYWDGARLAVPALPHLIGVTLGAVLVWLALAAVVTWLAELARRHHKALAVHAARHGKRGTIAAARMAGRGGRSAGSRLASWAGQRWADRQEARRRANICQSCGNPGTPGNPLIIDEGYRTHTSHMTTGTPLVPAGIDPRLNKQQVQRDTEGKRGECSACGNPFTPGDPMVIAPDGYRVHTSHTTDPKSGYHDPAGAPAPAVPAQNGETTMANASRINPDRRAHRAASQSGGKVPSEWGPVVAAAADFEPENDAHLLEWMGNQVAGMGAYAEGLIEAYETGINAVGLDPKGLATLHDVADAAAHCAEIMNAAKHKFTEHYELPREFAANGGLAPHDGRWVTGEGG